MMNVFKISVLFLWSEIEQEMQGNFNVFVKDIQVDGSYG